MMDRLDDLAAGILRRRHWRALVALAFVLLHLATFVSYGKRLGYAFDAAPGHPPSFVDPEPGKPPELHGHWTRLVVSRFDAEHYENFAARGFTGCPAENATPQTIDRFNDTPCGIEWLPGYGLVGYPLTHLLPIGPDYALLIVSLLACFALMYLWTAPPLVRRFGALATIGGLIALNAFPNAFYLVAIYAEGLTLALLVAAFLALCLDRWVLSAFLIGAATACRPTAVGFSLAFGIGALLRLYRERKARGPGYWRPLFAAPLAAWGLVATMTFYAIRFHDFLLYNHARIAYGDRPDVSRIWNLTLYVRGLASREYDMVVLGALVVLVLLGAWPALRRCRPEERSFLVIGTVFGVLTALMNASERWGLNRYFLLALLAFYAAGQVARRMPAVFVAWILFCLPLYYNVALCTYLTHGDISQCPLTGPRDGLGLAPAPR